MVLRTGTFHVVMAGGEKYVKHWRGDRRDTGQSLSAAASNLITITPFWRPAQQGVVKMIGFIVSIHYAALEIYYRRAAAITSMSNSTPVGQCDHVGALR